MNESHTKVVRALRGGQVTIPASFREELGLGPETLLEMSLERGELRIRPLQVTRSAKGSPWLKELYDLFAPARKEATSYSETEIDAAGDEAVRAVRRRLD